MNPSGFIRRITRISLRTLRHWDEVGLLRPSGRTEGGFRLYTEADVEKHIPVLPLGRRLTIPMVHADDVADAIVRSPTGALGRAFNLAAAPAITTNRIAEVLRDRPVHAPSPVVRAVVSAPWHASVQQVETVCRTWGSRCRCWLLAAFPGARLVT